MEKVEWFNNTPITFTFSNKEWKASLNDICRALDISIFDAKTNITNAKSITVDPRTNEDLIDEVGIYDLLLMSELVDARTFRMWSMNVIKKLREQVGLAGYEVLQMTRKDIQEDINDMLDTIFYDADRGMLMQSCTTYGGDVTVIPFEVETA